MAALGVRAGAFNLFLPAGEVVEVLPLPTCTPIPLTQPCFRGLINVRGSLYSVLDLAVLLGFAPAPLGGESRILLLQPSRIRYTALLVSRLAGMYPEGHFKSPIGDQPPRSQGAGADLGTALQPGWVGADDTAWHFLDVAELVSAPGFLDVGVPIDRHPETEHST